MNIGTVALEAARAELAARFRLVTITSLLVLALRSSCHCPPADVYTQSLSLPRDLTLPLSFHLPLLFSALSFSTPLFPPPSPFLRSLLFHPSLSTSLSFSPLSPFPPLSISTSSPVHSSLLFTHTPRPYHHQDHINATLSAQVPSFESTPSPFRSPLPFTPYPHHHQDHINATLSAQ
ncbi:unnamed protein product, partial [Closterium sp. NIES-65]